MAQVRTWQHREPEAWRPLFSVQDPCGCWTSWGGMLEPCMAHESEGHVSVISPDQDGLAVARCLVGECAWMVSLTTEGWAVEAAQKHWSDTRVAGVTST